MNWLAHWKIQQNLVGISGGSDTWETEAMQLGKCQVCHRWKKKECRGKILIRDLIQTEMLKEKLKKSPPWCCCWCKAHSLSLHVSHVSQPLHFTSSPLIRVTGRSPSQHALGRPWNRCQSGQTHSHLHSYLWAASKALNVTLLVTQPPWWPKAKLRFREKPTTPNIHHVAVIEVSLHYRRSEPIRRSLVCQVVLLSC